MHCRRREEKKRKGVEGTAKKRKKLLHSQEQLIGYFRCAFACFMVFFHAFLFLLLGGLLLFNFFPECVLGSCWDGQTKEIAFS